MSLFKLFKKVNIKKMNILLTGGSGFIGSHILEELSKNNLIYITVRKKKFINTKFKKYLYFKDLIDLNKKLKNIKVDIVIHCATHYVKNHNFKDLNKFTEANILFGNTILENLKIMKVKKFINFTTVWEDYNSIKNNSKNLYSVYKKSFTNIVDFYNKLYPTIKVYHLYISETFGLNDKRKKIINVLKSNYKKNIFTKIVSKNLLLNLINIDDIVSAVKIILYKKITPNKYVLKNDKSISISKLINEFNKINDRKIKVKWLSKNKIHEKIFSYKTISAWKPIKSNISNIIQIIKK